jgi:hypothetical protein
MTRTQRRMDRRSLRTTGDDSVADARHPTSSRDEIIITDVVAYRMFFVPDVAEVTDAAAGTVSARRPAPRG